MVNSTYKNAGWYLLKDLDPILRKIEITAGTVPTVAKVLLSPCFSNPTNSGMERDTTNEHEINSKDVRSINLVESLFCRISFFELEIGLKNMRGSNTFATDSA